MFLLYPYIARAMIHIGIFNDLIDVYLKLGYKLGVVEDVFQTMRLNRLLPVADERGTHSLTNIHNDSRG